MIEMKHFYTGSYRASSSGKGMSFKSLLEAIDSYINTINIC